MSQILQNESNLYFTGNWFIDIGILGFINLMEEIYGWDVDKLQEKVLKEQEKVYYGYFPFAYFSKLLLDKKENDEMRQTIDKLRIELETELKSNNTDKGVFEGIWYRYICSLYKDKWVKNIQSKIRKLLNSKKQKDKDELEDMANKLQIKEKIDEITRLLNSERSDERKKQNEKLEVSYEELGEQLKEHWDKVIQARNISSDKDKYYRLPIQTSFYTNFLFFNNSFGHSKQRESFYYLISYNVNKRDKSTFSKTLSKLDKTINKLLPSEDDFSNIFYTNTSSRLLPDKPFLFVYLICFIYGFVRLRDNNIVFYSNNLEFCYKVNKRLRMLQDNKDGQDQILKVWDSIIDVLIEHKSEWSLENMYIISYRKLDNQTQKGVKYIGIPRLQASILIDDKLRRQLNKRIQIMSNRNVWLIEEFIKGIPLHPYIQEYIKSILHGNKRYQSLYYPLMVDAKILELRAEKNNKPFSSPSYINYRNVIREIKEETRSTYYTTSLLKDISDDAKRSNIALELLSALEARDKNVFLNILLRNLNIQKELCSNCNLIKYIHDKIICKPSIFKLYGLALIIGLLTGEENE